MSLTAWKEKFYPTEPSADLTEIQAIKHSIKKWKGLDKKTLEKFELEQDGNCIVGEEGIFSIDSDSCALCIKYSTADSFCSKSCPIYKCDTYDDSPWVIWNNEGNTAPMLKSLNSTLKRAQKTGKSKK